jgi:hypothetical protein
MFWPSITHDQPMEINMTPSKSNLTLSALAAVSAMMVASAFVSAAEASTTSKLLRCQGGSKKAVMDCCEATIENHKRPIWMAKSEGACGAVVVCTGGRGSRIPTAVAYVPAKKKCYIQIPRQDGTDGNGPNFPKDRPEPQRDSFNDSPSLK